jgi:hypothetical protein
MKEDSMEDADTGREETSSVEGLDTRISEPRDNPAFVITRQKYA